MRKGVAGFSPERLTQARDSLGLTKAALANMLGVSAPTIGYWESGKLSPEEEKLRLLSQVLNLPIRFFLNAVAPAGEKPYFYRSMAVATKSARSVVRIRMNWLAEISSVLESWLDWPAISIPSTEEHFLNLADDDIENLALKCREAMGLGLGPIQDAVLAIESSGAICTRGVLGNVKIEGCSHWDEGTGRPFVFLAADKASAIRSRFDVAHELGHLVLHRHVTDAEQKKYHKEIESQAHRFAGAWLLPASSFLDDVSWTNLDSLLALKSRWKVSVAAMIMRLWNLGVISDEQKLNLYKRRSAKWGATKEPDDHRYAIEQPKLLNRAILMLVDNGHIGKSDLLDKFRLSPVLVESLLNLSEDYFKDDIEVMGDNLVRLKTVGPSKGVSNSGGSVVSFVGKKRDS